MAHTLTMLKIAGLFVILLSIPSTIYADGFRNPFQSGAANAQGNAFLAQADDASAVYYNPAGIARLRGIQSIVGVEFLNIDTNFENSAGTTTENDLGGPFGLPPPAQAFVTVTPRDLGAEFFRGLSFGMGLQNMYGFSSKYPDNGPFNTAVIEAKLPLLDIKPTIAYQFTDWLSFGGGVDIFTFFSPLFGKAKQEFMSPGLPNAAVGSRVIIDGTGTTVGGNVGVLFTPVRTESGEPKLNIGFVWRSQADLPLNGDLIVDGVKTADSASGVHFPDSYSAGIAAWPVRNINQEWKLEIDVDYVRWSTNTQTEFRFSDGVTITSPQSWSNSATIGIGTEYKWLSLSKLPAWDLSLRGGYNFSMTPVPDVNFTPAFSDSDVHTLSIGLGLTCHPGGKFLGFAKCGTQERSSAWRNMGLDLAYQLILFEPRTVSGNPNPTVDGKYNTINQAITLSNRIGF